MSTAVFSETTLFVAGEAETQGSEFNSPESTSPALSVTCLEMTKEIEPMTKEIAMATKTSGPAIKTDVLPTFIRDFDEAKVPNYQKERGFGPIISLRKDTVAELKRNLSMLIFRRVNSVSVPRGAHVRTDYYLDGKRTGSYAPPSTAPRFSPEEYEHNVEEVCTEFSFTTSPNPLKENDVYAGVSMIGDRESYAVLDPIHFDFDQTTFGKTTTPPRAYSRHTQGDLVCGIPSDTFSGRCQMKFLAWFTCSEQFYRMWVNIMKGVLPGDGRKELMSGNRLCSATFRKWTLSMIAENKERTPSEIRSRYYRLRTEPMSVNHVHIYAAMVLIFGYTEYPWSTNVPRNRDRIGPKIASWDLPEGWLDQITTRYMM